MRFNARITSFLRELKRRKVFHVGSVYLVVAWGASVGAADLLPAFGVPDWGVRAFVVTAILGFPVAVALAWIYETSIEVRYEAPASAPRATTRVARYAPSVQVSWSSGDDRRVESFVNNFTIGRDADCEVCVDDDMVSRRHARVFMQNGRWHVRDLGSRNGTRLDGELVDQAPLPENAGLVLYPGGPVLRLHTSAEAATLANRSKTVNRTAPG